MGSYHDQFGGGNVDSYTIMFADDGNRVSWYEDSQLSYVRHGGEDTIRNIIAEREVRESQERDLKWIALNWATIRKRVPGATAEELMRHVGIPNPWGSQGEGMAWYANWQQTFAAVDPILSDQPTDPHIALLGIRLSPIDVRIG